MEMAFALAIILSGFILGFLAQKLTPNVSQFVSFKASKFALLVLIPFGVLSSLWQLPNISSKLIAVPFVGVAVIASGACIGFISRRVFGLTRP